MTTIDRIEPPQTGAESSTLAGYLDYHRATLEQKCAGLTDDQLRERAVPPSTLTLLGLVRHLTEVERGWFGERIAGMDMPPLYYDDTDNPDGDFDDVDTADVAQAFDAWREACEQSKQVLAATSSLDDLGKRGNGTAVSVRWIMVHMIEEYARHNGHADLLRERVDGTTGE